MSKFPKTLSIAFFVLVLFIQSNNAQSFYSQRGIGLLNYFVTAKGVGMGGVGLASSDKLAVNFLNPAALTNLPVTFISGNFRHDAVGLKSNSVDASLSDSNVMGVQFHIPLIKESFSMALGLMPLSNIEYSFKSEGVVSGNSYDEFYAGDGGVNNVFFSLAVKPFKRLSVGTTGLFYFGSLRNVWRVVFNESSDLLNARTEVSRSFTAGNIRLGMQYDVLPVWRVAAVFTPSVSINTNKTVYLKRVSSFDDFQDTDIEIPLGFGIGTNVHIGRKFLVGVDYYVQKWSDTDFDGYTSDSKRIGVGAEFSGRGNPINSSFWSRTALRAGFYYHDLGLEDPVGENVTEMFVTMGLGLPIKWSAGRLDLALEIGERGSLSRNPVKEDVVRFSASMTVGERWFVRGGAR